MHVLFSFLKAPAIVALILSGLILGTSSSHAGSSTGKAVKKADSTLSCDQIAHEVVELDQVIREARDSRQNSDNAGTGISVARTVGSLLVGSLGGVVGIVAVGALAGEVADDAGEDAAAIEENAAERQSRLAGVYEGKGCEGELALTQDNHDNHNQDDVATLEPAAGQDVGQNKGPPRYND